MEIQRNSDVLFVKLGDSCTIVDVEEHTERLRGALLSDDRVRRLDMDAGQVEEIDTAYLQLLLVARAYMEQQGGDFSVRRTAACVDEALACYGMKL